MERGGLMIPEKAGEGGAETRVGLVIGNSRSGLCTSAELNTSGSKDTSKID